MGLSVQTNLAALNAANNLTRTQNQLANSLQKLSSGFRINTAADDAAGLAISEGMRSQMGGITVGIRNAQDGISVVQTAEGALNETTSILQRMRDLSVQGANSGALTPEAGKNIQTELTKLKTTLDNIASNTKFNGKTLLNGAYNADFQVGANAGETINVTVGTIASSLGLGVNTVDVTTAASAGYISGLKVGDTIAATAGTNSSVGVLSQANLTALKSDATFAIGGQAVNTSSLNGTTDTAATLAAAINATVGMSAIASASVDATGKLVLTSASTGATGTAAQVTVAGTVGNVALFGSPVAGANSKVAATADVTANLALAGGAVKAIDLIDSAIKKVSTERANLGATQNQFDHTINNQNVALQNVTASESRIRDTDMAATMVDFTKSQILSQAGVAMLAQAKSLPQDVLKLLQ
ncbi:MAG: flagellin [Cellulomonas sp.]|nr:flagellin [Cellulomonas sp.]